MNISEFFFEKSREHHDKKAFVIFHGEEKRDITYGEIAASVRRLAGNLSKKIDKGEKAAIFSENRPEWCIAYLAVTSVGCIAVPIDSEYGDEEVKNILFASQAKLAFCSNGTSTKLRRSGIAETNVINFDAESYRSLQQGDVSFGLDMSPISEDDIASIIYTSGTTGEPKGVMLSHGNFITDALAVIETGIVTGKDNLLSVLPLHHTYAFMCTFLVPFFVGACVTYPATLKGPDLAHAVKEAGVTVLIGVPQLLDLFYFAIRRNIDAMPLGKRVAARAFETLSRFVRNAFGINIGKVLFRSVHARFGRQFRIMASGGASLSVATMEGLEALGFTVLEGYGLTETSPVVTFNPLKKRKPGSAGRPLPGVEIKIDKGEILIKGDIVMKGYYRMPDETESVLREGWFYTGDLGYLDKDGYLFITGRTKEVIVLSSGKNIYPEEIEQAYERLPLIKECCVTDKREVDAVTLYALVVPDLEYARTVKIANLKESLAWDMHEASLALPQFMRVKGFTIYNAPLPRTRLGKLRRFMIKDIVNGLETKKTVPDSVRAEELDGVSRNVVERVKQFVADDVPVRLSDNLELDLGIDSLKRVELTVELERAFSLTLPATFLVDVQTVSEISEKIKDVSRHGIRERKGEPGTFKDMLLKKPDEDQIRAIGLAGGRVASLCVGLLLKACKVFSKVYFNADVEGIRNIPAPPFILIANHASYLDGFIIASHIPFRVFKKLFFQGAQKYFAGRAAKLFARVAHVIPIDPDAHLASALSLSAFVLRERRSLFIFPEGGRSFDGSIMPFRKGIGILSSECGVPLVPVKIKGTYESMPRGAFFPRRTKISLTIGPPITVVELERIKEKGGDVYREIADYARGRVEGL